MLAQKKRKKRNRESIADDALKMPPPSLSASASAAPPLSASIGSNAAPSPKVPSTPATPGLSQSQRSATAEKEPRTKKRKKVCCFGCRVSSLSAHSCLAAAAVTRGVQSRLTTLDCPCSIMHTARCFMHLLVCCGTNPSFAMILRTKQELSDLFEATMSV